MPESKGARLKAAGKALYVADGQGWDWDQLDEATQEAWVAVAADALERARGTIPRYEIVSLRDEIRQLRRTIEQERGAMVPYHYPIYPWWLGPYYAPAWWIWWGTAPVIYEASDEITGGTTVTYGSMDAQRHSAQLDFPGFCCDYLAAVQERTGTWASDEMLAGTYAGMPIEVNPALPDGVIRIGTATPEHDNRHWMTGITPEHADLASAARQTPEDAAARLKRLFS